MAFSLKTTSLASGQIRDAARWWRTHRTKAPKLFAHELRTALKLISEHPEIGAVTDDVEIVGVRRVLLVATHHYLYYRVNQEDERIEVLAVWSSSRGERPGLS